MKELIKKLSDMKGISGYENRINEKIKDMLLEVSDNVYIDTLGNVIAEKKCGKENAKKVMIEAIWTKSDLWSRTLTRMVL